MYIVYIIKITQETINCNVMHNVLKLFYKIFQSSVLGADGTVNKKKKRKVSRASNEEIINKCLRFMADCAVTFVVDQSRSPERSTVLAYSFALQHAIQSCDSRLEILLQQLNAYWKLVVSSTFH